MWTIKVSFLPAAEGFPWSWGQSLGDLVEAWAGFKMNTVFQLGLVIGLDTSPKCCANAF